KPAAKAAAKPAKAKSGGGSKFDFKAFLLQHGERVGLAVAAGLTLLVTGFALFWPDSGVFAPSSSKMAADLKDPADKLESQLNNPNTLPTDNDKPPKDADPTKFAFNPEPVKGQDFLIVGLVPQDPSLQMGRRQPKVKPVEEARVALARVQVQTYLMRW